MALTGKQQAFVTHYLENDMKNAAEAYRFAGAEKLISMVGIINSREKTDAIPPYFGNLRTVS